MTVKHSFNTQPPEGGWKRADLPLALYKEVSTHSRPKAAGISNEAFKRFEQRFNTQPPEGGWCR